MNKSQILEALPKLSQADLAAVHAMAGHLLSATMPTSAPDSLTYDAIVVTLNLTAHMAPNAARALASRQPVLFKFFDEYFPGWNKSKIVQTAFLQYMMGILRNNLIKVGVRPTPLIMIKHLHRVPEVFEDSFPGYLNCGIATALILERLSKCSSSGKGSGNGGARKGTTGGASLSNGPTAKS
jgi:hypothetical protein